MDLLKTIVGFVFGAGKGYLGTLIRTSSAAVGGYFLSKGWLDATAAAGLTNYLIGIGALVMTSIGSHLNNQAK